MTATPYPMQTPAQSPPPPIPALPGAPGGATRTAPAVAQGGSAGSDVARVQDAAGRAAADAQQAANDAARIAQEVGGTVAGGSLTTSTSFPVDPEGIIREAVPLFGMTFGMVVAIFIGFPIARAFARRIDRQKLAAGEAAMLQPQIRQLQESLDAMAVELERIGEAQRFQAKLLAERSQSDAHK